MITIRRQETDPPEPGDYVVVLKGSPLVVCARRTGDYWIRGGTKLWNGVWGYAGPVKIEKGRKNETELG